MKQRQVAIFFLVGLTILISIFFKTVIIYKTEFFWQGWNHWNPVYKWTLLGISIAFVIFNHVVMRIPPLKNIIYSVISCVVLYIIAFIIVNAVLGYLNHLDAQRTPLGWQFQYKWFELLIYGVLLVIGTEILGKRIFNVSI